MVADTGDGVDEVGRGGVWLYFAAQLADVDVQIVRVGSGAGAPELGEQHLARHDLALVLHQDFEQIVLGWCQLWGHYQIGAGSLVNVPPCSRIATARGMLANHDQ